MPSNKSSTSATLQTMPIRGREAEMVRNNYGGMTFAVSDRDLVRRYLFLGTTRPQLCASAASDDDTSSSDNKDKVFGNNTVQLVQAVDRIVASGQDAGVDLVNELRQISLDGRCAKQDPLLMVLALVARRGDRASSHAAYGAVADICRIPTFLFTFIKACQSAASAPDEISDESDDSTKGKGWGRAQRYIIANWYLNQSPEKLAFSVTKYRQRGGWSHKDVLRLCHAKPKSQAHQVVLEYVIEREKKASLQKEEEEEEKKKKEKKNNKSEKEMETEAKKVKEWKIPARTALEDFPVHPDTQRVREFLNAVDQLATLTEEAQVQDAITLINKFRLAREHIPTSLLQYAAIWESMLPHMPLTAMMRTLNRMTNLGLLDNDAHCKAIVNKLTDLKELTAARMHPFNVLSAMRTYAKGCGFRGGMTWCPNQKITDALESAFKLSFKAVTPTNKRFLLALDVSGSMAAAHLLNSNVSAREASVAMAMVTAATEPFCHMVAFQNDMVDISSKISPTKSLDANVDAIEGLPFGSTDCAQPMLYALKRKMLVDCFVVYTDNETYFGEVHPCEALKEYRTAMGIDAKLIVVGMTATQFTIADPADRGSLDVVGFDSSAPEVMSQFAKGEI